MVSMETTVANILFDNGKYGEQTAANMFCLTLVNVKIAAAVI